MTWLLFSACALVSFLARNDCPVSATSFPKGYYRFLSPTAVLQEDPRGEEEGEPVNLVIPELGILEGIVRTASNGFKFSSFRGVPYAEPPTGENRFQPTAKQKPWKGERKAVKWGAYCMQVDVPNASEDCLYLNIETPFTKRADKLLPILFEIHGGGFIGGSGNLFPDALIRNGDLVYVSINYRLGAFGFLSTGDAFAPGNYGLMDQIAALTWVQAYAHYFGGDAARVTISGGSAGAASVHQLILSPLARGLFTQAISHSGSALSPWAIRKDPLSATRSLAAALNCQDYSVNKLAADPGKTITHAATVFGEQTSIAATSQPTTVNGTEPTTTTSAVPQVTSTVFSVPTTYSQAPTHSSAHAIMANASVNTTHLTESQQLVECLKNKAAQEILSAQENLQEEGSAFHFVPTVDGYVIPREPAEMLAAGDFANVTWITGNVQDEGVLFAGAALTDGNYMTTLDTGWETSGCRDALQIPGTVGEDKARKVCQRARTMYFQDRRIDFQSIYSLIQMAGDRWFNVPTLKSAIQHAQKARVYLYMFKFQGKYAVINIINGIAQKLGLPALPAAVSHGDDYAYRSSSGNFTDHEGKIGAMYSGMIRHFVTTGVPKPSLPEYQIDWRQFDPAKNDFVRQTYDDYVRLETFPDPGNLISFWDSLEI